MPTFLFRRLGRLWLLAVPVLLLFSSCASTAYYQKRTLFRLTDSQGRQLDSTKLRVALNRTERNYVIQPNDFLEVRVNTNKGERILDPNGELSFGQPSGTLPSRGSVVGGQGGGAARSSAPRSAGQGAGRRLFIGHRERQQQGFERRKHAQEFLSLRARMTNLQHHSGTNVSATPGGNNQKRASQTWTAVAAGVT